MIRRFRVYRVFHGELIEIDLYSRVTKYSNLLHIPNVRWNTVFSKISSQFFAVLRRAFTFEIIRRIFIGETWRRSMRMDYVGL